MSVGRICNREMDTARPVESVYVIAERMHQARLDRWSS